MAPGKGSGRRFGRATGALATPPGLGGNAARRAGKPTKEKKVPQVVVVEQAPRAGRGKKQGGNKQPTTGRQLSGMNQSLIPAYMSTGDAFPIRGMARTNMLLGAGEQMLIACTNCGDSGTLVTIAKFSTPAGPVVLSQMNVPLMALASTAGGPTSARPMKCSLVFTCNTPVLDRGGVIYRLHSQSRLAIGAAPSGFSSAAWYAVGQTIAGHPDVRVGDLADYGHPRELICNVVDHTRYQDFTNFAGTATFDQFWQRIAVWPTSVELDRPMSTSFYFIESPSKAQSIGLVAYGQWYTRWPLDTVPGQAMRPVPTAPAEKLNAMHKAALVTAHTPHSVTVE